MGLDGFIFGWERGFTTRGYTINTQAKRGRSVVYFSRGMPDIPLTRRFPENPKKNVRRTHKKTQLFKKTTRHFSIQISGFFSALS